MKPDNAARAFCAVINKSFLAKESEGKKPATKQVKFEESKKDAPTPPDAKAPEKPKSTQKEKNAKKKGPDEGASSSKQVPKKKEKPPKKSEGFTIEEPDHGAGVGKPEANPPPSPRRLRFSRRLRVRLVLRGRPVLLRQDQPSLRPEICPR